MGRGGTCILGCRFHLSGSSEGGIFRFRGRSVVVTELKGDICILGRHFQVPWLGVLGWEAQRAAFFSGLEGTWLCLMNSGAALASWGAVFTCLGAQRAAFFRFREFLVVVAEFRGGLCILGSRFSRAKGAWMERQSSEGHRAHCRCRAQGAAFSLKVVISQNKLATVLQLSHKKDERRGA